VKLGMEFVPMIRITEVDLMDGSSCDMTVNSGPEACTVDKLVSVIESSSVVNQKYLMGWNEPYKEHYIDPSDAALLWAKFLIPVAG